MTTSLYLPSIRAKMGDWFFYTCTMSLSDVASRVSYADEIHKNKKLSKLIQREIKDGRQQDIKNYLLEDKERFFGALIVAVYGGDPSWRTISITRTSERDLPELAENIGSNLGFLELSGTEKLFALDGQHRLAGVKAATEDNEALGSEQVAVLFVGHSNTAPGLRRTRKLFTTLNKNAKSTTKSEVIALDENDLMAIVTRRLVEDYLPFMGSAIVYNKGNNIPATNKTALTSIVNLYDIVSILVGKVLTDKTATKWRNSIRPGDGRIQEVYSGAAEILGSIIKNFNELKDYFSIPDPQRTAQKYRNASGGSVLFRPVGLLMFFEILSELCTLHDTDAAIRLLATLPTDISKYPYRDLFWSNRIVGKNKTLMRDVLLHWLGVDKRSVTDLVTKVNDAYPNADFSKHDRPVRKLIRRTPT